MYHIWYTFHFNIAIHIHTYIYSLVHKTFSNFTTSPEWIFEKLSNNVFSQLRYFQQHPPARMTAPYEHTKSFHPNRNPYNTHMYVCMRWNITTHCHFAVRSRCGGGSILPRSVHPNLHQDGDAAGICLLWGHRKFGEGRALLEHSPGLLSSSEMRYLLPGAVGDKLGMTENN